MPEDQTLRAAQRRGKKHGFPVFPGFGFQGEGKIFQYSKDKHTEPGFGLFKCFFAGGKMVRLFFL